jgi:hypothetical protein
MDPLELHVYDFDETLYFPPRGHGTLAFFHVESFGDWKSPGYDNRWHLANVVRARRSIADPLTVAVLLTARPDNRPMRDTVESMLASASLDFDMVKLKPVVQSFRSDAHYKAVFITEMLRQFPTVRKVVFYDDQRDNLAAAEAVVRSTGRAYKGVL